MDPSTGLLQEISSHSLENMLCSNAQQDRKPRPQPEQALKCPRCDSTNTKFCYYNNYSLSQPRYFCKSCRRYWTKGGTLRNVPVGGGCRKNKRSSSSSASSKRPQDQPFTPNPNLLNGLPALSYDSNDLTLAIARLQNQSNGQMGYDGHDFSVIGNPSPAHCDIIGNHGFVDAIRSGFLENQNNLQSLYYGYRNGEFENGNSGTAGVSEEMMLAHYDKEMSNATSQAVTVKQELCSAREQQSDNRVLWGFPWQFNGEGNIADFDSGRGSWNSFNSSWHGLLNSPLM